MAPTGQIVKDFTISRINLIPGAHAIVQRLRQGATLLLARDPADKYDPNAIMVIVPNPGSKRKVGYLPPGLAKELAPLMDAGLNIIARKAPNPLYGVAQIAYIPPAPKVIEDAQPKVIEARTTPKPVVDGLSNRQRAQAFADRAGVSIPDMGIEPTAPAADTAEQEDITHG